MDQLIVSDVVEVVETLTTEESSESVVTAEFMHVTLQNLLSACES